MMMMKMRTMTEKTTLYCVLNRRDGAPFVRPRGGPPPPPPDGGYGCKCMPDMFDVETESEKKYIYKNKKEYIK